MQKRRLEDIVTKPRREGPAREYARVSDSKPKPPETVTLPSVDRRPPFEPTRLRERPERISRRRTGFSWIPVAAIISVVVIGTAFLLSFVFSGATVTVHPKTEQAFIDGTFIAAPEAGAGQLSYKLLSVEEVATQAVAASGEEEVEERATGRITIYNAFDENPQRLIKNTRFESADGKIFRIQDFVIVPGAKGVGEAMVPGSVEAGVFADEPGESYNIPAGRFTIPGFDGTDRYDHFYAESKEAMVGGVVGIQRVVTEEQKAATIASLSEGLRTTLAEKAFTDGQKPENFYLYKDAVFYRFDPLPTKPKGDDEVEISVRGTAYAVLFEKTEFAQFIASQAVAGYDNEPVIVQNPDAIAVSTGTIPGEATSTPPWEGGTVSVSISGTAHVVWTYDAEAFKADLVGRETTALEAIRRSYPGIEQVTVVHRPFWKSVFPDTPEDIEIIESLD